MSRPVISLTTDFGEADSYVGTMKGAILGICPEATLVDICHQIRPQAVHQAAYLLSTATPYFPLGTVHLVVIDPGVGSKRRPVVVRTRRATYVAPDNGVLSQVLDEDPACLVVFLTAQSYRLRQVSATFHGRDIFAPAAAYLACGVDPHEMGDTIPASELVTLPALHATLRADGVWQARVLHVDRFGNLVTNLRIPMGKTQTAIDSHQLALFVGGEQVAGLSHTFTAVAPGQLVAYIGSSGYLEVAVREGNAAAYLGVDVGEPVEVKGLSWTERERPALSKAEG